MASSMNLPITNSLFITDKKMIILICLLASISPINSAFYYLLLHKFNNIFSHSCIQWIFLPYVGGFALSQFIYGPFSDAIGRKPVILGGLIIYIFALLLNFLDTSLISIALSRLLQGIGAGYTIVMCRSIQRDIFKDKKYYIYGAYISTMLSSVALLSPVIAGSLMECQQNNELSLIFILLIYSIICFFILLFFLPETHYTKSDNSIFYISWKAFFRNIKEESKVVMLFISGSIIYICEILIYIFIPSLIKDILNLGYKEYGMIISCITFNFTIGSFLSYKMNKRIEYSILIDKGIVYLGRVAVTASFLILFFEIRLIYCFLCILLFSMALGFTGSNITSEAIRISLKPVGFASSLYLSCQFILGTIFIYVISFINIKSIDNIIYIILVLSSILHILNIFIKKSKVQGHLATRLDIK